VNRAWASLVLGALLGVLAGCSQVLLPGRGAGVYLPLNVRVAAPVTARSNAIRVLAAEPEWTRARVSIDGRRFTGYRESASGIRTRVRVRVVSGGLSIGVRTELLDGPRWIHTDDVCADYDYARERAIAEALQSRLRAELH